MRCIPNVTLQGAQSRSGRRQAASREHGGRPGTEAQLHSAALPCSFSPVFLESEGREQTRQKARTPGSLWTWCQQSFLGSWIETHMPLCPIRPLPAKRRSEGQSPRLPGGLEADTAGARSLCFHPGEAWQADRSAGEGVAGTGAPLAMTGMARRLLVELRTPPPQNLRTTHEARSLVWAWVVTLAGLRGEASPPQSPLGSVYAKAKTRSVLGTTWLERSRVQVSRRTPGAARNVMGTSVPGLPAATGLCWEFPQLSEE